MHFASGNTIMKSSELVELAALVATYGPSVIRTPEPLSESYLRAYWSAAKCRLTRWGLMIARYHRTSEKLGETWARDQSHAIAPTMKEILASEMLTRTFSAVVCAHDRLHGVADAEPIAQSIYMGHLELRYRVLHAMADDAFGQSDVGAELNHLRRRCERWTDLLLGYLRDAADVSEFSFDEERCGEFAANLRRNRVDGVWAQAWNLTLSSLREAFRHQLPNESPDADLNARMAGGIIGCFPPEMFDSTGPLHALWQTRMETMADDAEEMVTEMLLIDEVDAARAPGRLRL